MGKLSDNDLKIVANEINKNHETIQLKNAARNNSQYTEQSLDTGTTEGLLNAQRRTIASFLDVGEDEVDPTTMEKIGATMRLENPVASYFAQSGSVFDDEDTTPTLDEDELWGQMEKDGLTQQSGAFVGVTTQRDYDYKKADIKREMEDREITSSMGFYEGIPYALLAGVLDPFSYIPIGGAFVKGGWMAKTAATSAAVGLQTSASELALQAHQEYRTFDESFVNVSLGVLLGGTIGVGANLHQYMSKKRQAALEMDMNDVIQRRGKFQGFDDYGGGSGGNRSVGAAHAGGGDRTSNTTRAQSNSKQAELLAKASDFVLMKPLLGKDVETFRNPEIEAFGSSSDHVRKAMLKIINPARISQDNADGFANPSGASQHVGDQIRAYVGKMADVVDETEKVYREAGGGRLMSAGPDGRGGAVDGYRSLSKYGTRDDLGKRVYRATINGDVDPQGDAVITRLAESWRKNTFAPILDDLAEAGVLDKDKIDLKGDKSYATRIYNRKAITDDADGFKSMAEEHYLRKLNDEYDAAVKRKASDVKPDDGDDAAILKLTGVADRRQEARRIAGDVYKTITDTSAPRNDYEISTGVRGFGKARSLDIPSAVLADAGYLVDNVFDIGQRYVRSAGTDAALAKHFRKAKIGPDGKPIEGETTGDVMLEDVVARIKSDADAELSAPGLDPELEKLIKADRDRDVAVIEAVRKRLRGEMNHADFTLSSSVNVRRAMDLAMSLNFMRLLGGTVLSSLPDLASMTLVHGFGPTVKNGLLPLVRDLKANGLAGSEQMRLARLAGANIELALNSRVAAMAGLDDPLNDLGTAQQFQRNATQAFATYTGISHWNALVKQVAYNTTQARFLDNAVRGYSKLSKRERALMDNLGLDAETLERIRKSYEGQSTRDVMGAPVAQWDEWADVAAAEKMKAALGREVNNQIITPEMSDLPTFYATPVGRMLMQFKSHMLASQARVVGRNVQLAGLGENARDGMAGFYVGMSGMLVLAGVADYLKAMAGTSTIDGTEKRSKNESAHDVYMKRWEDNPAGSFFNVLDRSSFSPVLSEWDGLMSKMAGISARRAAGLMAGDKDLFNSKGEPAKLRSRSPADLLLGPTAGLAFDGLKTLQGLSQMGLSGGSQPMTRDQMKAMRRLFPGQNAFPIQTLGNTAEHGAGMSWDWRMN